MKFGISHTESGAPLSHVDWSVIIIDPSGNEVYRTMTAHSHVGTERFSFAFLDSGEYNVHVEVASLGPTMMGMDVPAEAQTRIFESGDPMMSPEVDETFFFGTRSHDFVVEVGSPGGIQTVTTESGHTVEIALSTSPERIVVGQPTTLIVETKEADTGMHITHTDALVVVRQGSFVLTTTAAAGDPMMPIEGSFHGHTGQMAFTTVFPTTGVYYVQVATNSLPVSDVQYGKANAVFRVLATGTAPEPPVPDDDDDDLEPDDVETNQVSILGQATPYYEPNDLTVSVGETVTFTNDDFVLHTATSINSQEDPTPDGAFDTGLLNNGESAEVAFDEPGTYDYFCAIHPQMRGTITVT